MLNDRLKEKISSVTRKKKTSFYNMVHIEWQVFKKY